MYYFENRLYFGVYRGDYFDDVGQSTGAGSSLGGEYLTQSSHIYFLNNSKFTNVNYLGITFTDSETFPYFPEEYDYYYYISCSSDSDNLSDFDFRPDSVIANYAINQTLYTYNYSDFKVYDLNNRYYNGFSCSFKIDFNGQVSPNAILLHDSTAGTVGSNVRFWGLLVPIPKESSDEQVQSIISSINNQTTTLDGSIDQAADDVQQSIEDQYSGDPETEFSVDDVITQHNDKMGVLSFGSDVMLQFLDMFQSANVGTAQLTLPGFNITVENVDYSVWPDYSFNFEQLNEWVPGLMSVIRMMLPAFVWLMVLRYCINVFEKNFLSNGG